MTHYVYQITNNINGKYYLGAHSTENLDDGYMGSGKLIIAAIKKYGVENFTKTILEFFDTREEALAKEAELVTREEVDDPNCYNIKGGGEGGSKIYTDDELKQHARDSVRKYYEANKEVCLERDKKWREANKEARQKYMREYGQTRYERNREYYREHNKQYYEANKERLKQQSRKNYEKNKELNRAKHRAYMSEYEKVNKERLREYRRLYYLRRKAEKKTVEKSL